MSASRCFPALRDVASPAFPGTSALFADDFGFASSSPVAECDPEQGTWEDLPLPVSVRLPLDGPMACEAVLPAHYEARYAYPLIVWLSPGDEIEFRARISAISDRNFVGLALDWQGFDNQPSPSVMRTAECRRLIGCAIEFAESVWNIHPERRFLLAEGPAPCAWGMRLMEHSGDQFATLVGIQPACLPSPATSLRSASGVSTRKLLVCNATSGVNDDSGEYAHNVVGSWKRYAARLQWSVEFRQVADNVATSRVINEWLMSRVFAG